MGDYRQLGVFENLLANICFVKGDYTGAIDLCNKSIEREKNINNETDSSVNELLIGQCFFELGDYSEAETHFSIAQSLFDASDDKYYEYELLFYKFIIAILSNKIEAAYILLLDIPVELIGISHIKKVEKIYTELGNKCRTVLFNILNCQFTL